MDLTDVFSRSQKIWANKINSSHSRNTFSLKATNDANQLLSSSLKKCSDSQIEYGEGANITNPSEYYGSEQSMNDEIEVEKYVERSLERARLEMERTFLNQQILNREKHPFFEPLISEMKHEKLMVNSQQTTFTHGMLQDPEAELFAKAVNFLKIL
jgi:hypothetical protein